MKYVIKGDPVPLSRPRFAKGTIFDAQKHTKLVVGIDLRNQHDNQPFFEGPLQLDVTFFIKLPQRNKNKLDSFHHSKPDLDNLIKFVCDIGNGILYKDDALISIVNAQKKYSNDPRTEFEIIIL